MNRKVYKINKSGSIKNLRKYEESLPGPDSDEVQIKVACIGLNFADIFAMTGLYSATPSGPFIPGLEFSGVVSKIGQNSKKFKSGDKVMGVIRFGAYASELNVNEDYVFPLPEDWSFEEGAAFLVNAMTAYYALITLGNIKTDQNILIHSAAGGVGILAIRIAHKFGAHITGTIGAKNKIKALENENCNKIIVRGNDLKTELERSANGHGFDVVLESIGGSVFRISYELLAPQGRLITYGAANFTPGYSRPNYLKLLGKYMLRKKLDLLEMVSAKK